jgi:hypothetical protein
LIVLWSKVSPSLNIWLRTLKSFIAVESSISFCALRVARLKIRNEIIRVILLILIQMIPI